MCYSSDYMEGRAALKRLSIFGLAAIFSLAFPFSSASSQTSLLYRFDGSALDELGYSVAEVGDVDGDGKADFIIGVPRADPNGLTDAGSAFVYSGATGALLYRVNGAADFDFFGFSVAGAGDIDGDSRADFIAGAPFASPEGIFIAGSAFVYSGATGVLLYQKNGEPGDRLGHSVAGGGDMDGDDRADFIVGAYFADPGGMVNAGSAYVYSGADGGLLYHKDGTAATDRFGQFVAVTGDLNGDGPADFIVGAPLTDPGGLADAGSAYVYSGADGHLLYRINGASAGDGLGVPVAGTGDLNGDGQAEFLVGATFADPNGLADAGSLSVYSGKDGSLLFQENGVSAGGRLGFAVSGAGDLDGDGVPDFMAGAPFADPGGLEDAGSAFVFSGANGLLLFQKNGTSGDQLGWAVAGSGDLNGNGSAGFIVSARYADPGGLVDAGSVFVYQCLPRGDVNNDGETDVMDIVGLIQHVVFDVSLNSLIAGDTNCDGLSEIVDIVLLIEYLVYGTPALCCL